MLDTAKLLVLKGPVSARTPKIGTSEPVIQDIDTAKLLVLKGASAARAPKIGSTEPASG
ncbi:hypothetical protein [Tropicibacter sp. S64]|uniref:hypothetical protein n=1 Tax=Tropicibacter sp. S64 TaxID=3415122 RepID=UPI003C7B6179